MKQNKSMSRTLGLICIFLLFIGTYVMTPKIFTSLIINDYNESFEVFTSSLASNNDVTTLANQYAFENNANVYITNKTTQQLTSTPKMEVYSSYEKHKTIQNYKSETLEIDVQYTLKPLKQIKGYLSLLLPVLMVIVSCIYFVFTPKNKKVKEAYSDLYSTSEDMLRLKPRARFNTESTNMKKQQVINNLNQLYELLLDKNEQYDLLSQDYQLLLQNSKNQLTQEQQRIHSTLTYILEEIKKTLNKSSNYKNHTIQLMDIKVKLEDLLDQKNQPIALPSTIHDIFEKVLNPYKMLAGQKRVNFIYKFGKNFKIKVDDLLFHQMMGCLMSFILTQCDEESSINIAQDNYDIAIQYKGACLTDASIQKVLQMDQNIIDAYRYAKQMGFFIDYLQKEEKDGMQFVFHF